MRLLLLSLLLTSGCTAYNHSISLSAQTMAVSVSFRYDTVVASPRPATERVAFADTP